MVIKEIFTSLQGEGANQGKIFTFVRSAGCNLDCPFCDTDFSGGELYDLARLTIEVERRRVKNILWTGGEPTLQLTDEIVSHFKDLGYFQAIETNGTRRPPLGLDYIACSPKNCAEDGYRAFRRTYEGIDIDEIRIPVGEGIHIPDIDKDLPPARCYFLSPLFVGDRESGMPELSPQNLRLCLDAINMDHRWQLSVQLHKLLGFR